MWKGPAQLRPDPLCRHYLFSRAVTSQVFSGASELNFRVRDGNGWTLTAISTDSSMQAPYHALPPLVKARSFRCISSPNRTRFAGLRFGFGVRSHILLPLADPLRWVLLGFKGAHFMRSLYFNRFPG